MIYSVIILVKLKINYKENILNVANIFPSCVEFHTVEFHAVEFHGCVGCGIPHGGIPQRGIPRFCVGLLGYCQEPNEE